MAQFPPLDLFCEVDELATSGDGKCLENNRSFHFDEVDLGLSDHTSTEMILDDSMLAVDSSNNILFGDPLFYLSEPNEMLSLQPPNLDSNPETLIPVSLTADSPTSPELPSDTPGQTGGEAITERSLLRDSQQEEPSKIDSVEKINTNLVSSDRVEGVRPSAIRIKINTGANSSDEMVAPAILPIPSHNLVKIPKGSCSSQVVKVKPVAATCKNDLDKPKVEPLPRRSRLTAAKRQRRSLGACESSESESDSRDAVPKGSPASSGMSELESSPFWSLRSRHSSASSVVSQSSGAKRKAYELDPLNDPRMERCRRNAINAKKNREMKKAHVNELERKVFVVSRERDQLAGENESLREANVKLEEQVKHLRNLLENQSPLAALIGKLSPASVVVGEVPTGEGDDKIVSSASGR
ncbi:uncharacterized protein [Palaemon carinicauda]|uniref:uncharacterized protein n=1 Tax=Palaemon carinicauda TaxID=392227 RepID=UPI0035B58DE2